MKFIEMALEGVWLIEPVLICDERGFFARTYCECEFRDHGLEPLVAQANISYNVLAGTVRGMHYQVAPACEAKLVRCTSGAIYDVVVDVRPDSPTFLSHVGVELSERNRSALFVPRGFAHGYQALIDASEVSYQVSEVYTPRAERGAHHADPAFGISWPRPVTVISDKDATWPLMTATAAAPRSDASERVPASDSEFL